MYTIITLDELLMIFNKESKIDGCSLKRIGRMPFEVTYNLKCIGIPGSTRSDDRILLIDYDYRSRQQNATMYDWYFSHICITM